MNSTRRLWISVAILLWLTHGSAAAQESGSDLASLPDSPPLIKTIYYVGKTTTTDLTGPGMGQHLQYFPAFGLPEPKTGLRTDCDECIELTPDFENFKHHLPADLYGRTFSPDAASFGIVGDDDYVPEGVKTAGGNSNWDVLTLPDGTVGLSGTTYDTFACSNTNNSVNQIRINSSSLRDFCLNLITDNTGGTHDSNLRVEARSDDVDGALDNDPTSANFDPSLTFDGQTDVYTFRYMGMQEGDRIRIRLKGDGDPATCPGPGLGGIMVSHISTCTPPPGTCTPNCEGLVCGGDDGCGGSCGICPRADHLSEITGLVDVSISQNGSTLVFTESDIETPVKLSEALSGVLDGIETSLGGEFHDALVEEADDADVSLSVRDFQFLLTPKTIGIHLTALPAPNETLFELVFTLGGFFQHAKFKPKDSAYNTGPLNPNAQVDITATSLTATGTYDGQTGDIMGPHDPVTGTFAADPVGSIGDLFVDVDTNSDWDSLVDILGLVTSEPPTDAWLAREFEAAVGDELTERLGEAAAGNLGGLLRPALELVPESVEIGGVNYAPLIRNALLEPTSGVEISITYDASSPRLISGSDPIESVDLASLTVDIGSEFTIATRVRETTFPPILASMDSAFVDEAGDFTVQGWTCGEGLERSLEVGLFADGYAVHVERADRDSEPAIAEACGTDGSLNSYRYSLTPSPDELGCLNSWDDRIHLIAGSDGFEKGLRDVPRADSELWLSDADALTGDTVHRGYQFVGDFNGDGMNDYMYHDNPDWYVALSNGKGFDAPAVWISDSDSPSGQTNGSPGYQFAADFNGDGMHDLIYRYVDWYVALSNGNGFDEPTVWLSDSDSPSNDTTNQGWHFIDDFNGDGMADFMYHYNPYWYVALSDGSDFGPLTSWLEDGDSPNGQANGPAGYNFVADFNGDGKQDLMYRYIDWYIALSSGDGFNTPVVWLSDSDSTSNDTTNRGWHYTGDFDGDGNDDFMYHYDPYWYVALSDGSDFGPLTAWLADSDSPNGQANNNDDGYAFVADFDGDGTDDLMYRYLDWFAALSTRDRFDTPKRWLSDGDSPTTTYANDPDNQFIADFTGDGRPEFMYRRSAWYVASTLLPKVACEPVNSNPDGIDSDGDGLLDGAEDLDGNGQVDPGETDPANPDSDGDGYTDGEEVAAGSDPTDAGDSPPPVPIGFPLMPLVLTALLLAMGGRAVAAYSTRES